MLSNLRAVECLVRDTRPLTNPGLPIYNFRKFGRSSKRAGILSGIQVAERQAIPREWLQSCSMAGAAGPIFDRVDVICDPRRRSLGSWPEVGQSRGSSRSSISLTD
jgi:hypothetical protein